MHPSLWRQSELCCCRASTRWSRVSTRCAAWTCPNITFVEGDTGVIVIDPLVCTETAAAALALYRQHREIEPSAQ